MANSTTKVEVDTGRLTYLRVAEDIKANGYVPADKFGTNLNTTNWSTEVLITSVGILKSAEQPKEHGLFSFLRGKQMAEFVATLWFDNKAISADSKDWVMEVHGERHIKEMTEYAEKLASKYDVFIRVLVNPKEKRETLSSDFA